MIENYFSATIPTLPEGYQPTRMPQSEAQQVIVSTVCHFYELSPDDVRQGKGNSEKAELAMHVIRYFLRGAGMGIRQIERITAGDAYNSLKKVQGYIEVDPTIRGEISQLKRILRA